MIPLNIHTFCWNESLMMRQMFDFYKSRFPHSTVNFHIYDFGSDDGSRETAMSLGMKVFHVETGGTVDDILLMQLKNSVWKQAGGWAIVTDFDEWLDINEKQLAEEIVEGTTILKTEGWDICNVAGLDDFKAITTGVRYDSGPQNAADPLRFGYDKKICFDTRLVTEIRFHPGAHVCDPVGLLKYSERTYKILHMKYVNEEYLVSRCRAMEKRQSARNRQLGLAVHYFNFDEEKTRKRWRDFIAKAVVFR